MKLFKMASNTFSQKYCIGTSDGQYQLFWDITALLADLPNQNVPITYYKVSDLSKSNYFYGNSDYAMSTDTSKACIIVKLDTTIEKLIDGNHRLYKAQQLNYEKISCIVLPENYHKKFILDYDSSIYEKIVKDLK